MHGEAGFGKQPGGQPNMRNIHDKILRKCSEAVLRKGEHLACGIKPDIADVFKTHLWDFAKRVRLSRCTVYRFAVAKPLGQWSAFFNAAHDGKRNIRLERKQLPTGVVEG